MTSYKSNDTRDPITGQYIVGFSCPDAFDKASFNELMANDNDVLNSKELNSNYNLPKVPIHLGLGTPRSSSSNVTIHLGLGTFCFNYIIDKFDSIMAKSDRNPGKKNQYKTVCMIELKKKFYANRTFVHYPFLAAFDKASLKHNGMHL